MKTVIFECVRFTFYSKNLPVDGQVLNIEFNGGYDGPNGKVVPARFRTNDEKIIEALRSNPEFNDVYVEVATVDDVADSVNGGKDNETVQSLVQKEEDWRSTAEVVEGVSTVQEVSEWLKSNKDVPRSKTTTISAIKEWLNDEANPRIYFKDFQVVHE